MAKQVFNNFPSEFSVYNSNLIKFPNWAINSLSSTVSSFQRKLYNIFFFFSCKRFCVSFNHLRAINCIIYDSSVPANLSVGSCLMYIIYEYIMKHWISCDIKCRVMNRNGFYRTSKMNQDIVESENGRLNKRLLFGDGWFSYLLRFS